MERLDVRMVFAVAEHTRDGPALLGDAQALGGTQGLDVDATRHDPNLVVADADCQRHPGFSAGMTRAGLLVAGLAALGAEPDRLGERTALLGIIGGDHRIVGVKAPLLTILVGGHLIVGH